MPRLGLLLLVLLIGLAAGNGAAAQPSATRSDAVPVVEAISVGPWLRGKLPADTVFYARLPSPWGLLLAPDGRGLDVARVHPSVATAVRAIRAAFLKDPEFAAGGMAMWRVLLSHWAGPAEFALLAPDRIPGPQSRVLVSLPLAGVADADALAGLFSMAELPAPELDTAGYGLVAGIPLHFDARSGRLLLLGAGSTVEQLKEVQAALQPAAAPFAADEALLDRSGQGGYLWLDLVSVRALAAAGALQDPSMRALSLLASKGESFSFGFGSAGEKGRYGARLQAPDAPFLRYVPREPRRYDVRTVGKPGYVWALSVLYAPQEYDEFRTALEQDHGPEAVAKLKVMEDAIQEATGVALADLLGAVGPDVGGFGDAAGDFWFLRVRDRKRLERVLERIAEHPGVERRAQQGVQLLDLPGSQTPDNQVPALKVLERVRTRLFWRDEGEYLVFANTPQPLADRQSLRASADLRGFLGSALGADFEQAQLLYAGSNHGVARQYYEYSLLFLYTLADLAGARIDPFSFPSASQLDLPAEGSVAIAFQSSRDGLALSFAYDASFLDFFSGAGAMATVAVVGVLAAIALPAYQDYVARSQVAEAVMGASAAKIAIEEFTQAKGKPPASLQDVGIEADSLATRYADIVWRDGNLIVTLRDAEPVNSRIRGATVAIGLLAEPGWVCGYAGEATPEAFVGAAPSTLTSVPMQLLPSGCRVND